MNRREWLQTAAAGACGALSAFARPADLKVEKLELFSAMVGPRPWLIFRITASDGSTGLGDATHSDNPPTRCVRNARSMFEEVRGRGVFEIERLRQAALPIIAAANGSAHRPAAAALAGLEQCLWDLQGKAAGVPCYELFGGKLRDEIRNYANINRATRGEDRHPEGFAANAKKAVQAGFDAIKLASFDDMRRGETDPTARTRGTQFGIDCLAAVREAVGPDCDILVDGHGRFNSAQALDVQQRVEHLDLFWLEEMCPNVADLAAFNRSSSTPTAGGESLFGVEGFLAYVNADAVDIVMPDMKFCGGMYELKKIAALAEAAGMPCSPHGPASPVGNMAAAHVCATMPNFQILELGFGEVPWRADFVDPPEPIKNGRLRLLDRPGIGFELNEEIARPFEG